MSISQDYEPDLLAVIGDEWLTCREIIWEFNGPRVTTIEQGRVQQTLKRLVQKKVLERKKNPKRPGHTQAAVDGWQDMYRRRAA